MKYQKPFIARTLILLGFVLILAACGEEDMFDESNPEEDPNNTSSSSSSSGGETSNSSSSSSSSTSSSSSSSGTAQTPENCDDLSERSRSTDLPLSVTETPSGSGEHTPTVIAPLANGDSLVAWTDRTNKNIRLMKINNKDQKITDFPDLTGLEVHDIIETSTGFALAVMDNDPDIYSEKYCYSEATPGNEVCGKLELVQLDSQGNLVRRTSLTNKNNVDSVGAQFIWWYGHTARLVSDGTYIGVYFRSAMSVERPNEPGEIDIHAGDSLKFVDASNGNIIDGGWDWGCSHSWSVRIAYNGTNWAAACHGDAYPNAMQLAHLAGPSSSITYTHWQENTEPGQRALGGLVANQNGFWINYMQTESSGLALKLAHLENGTNELSQIQTIESATNLKADYPFRAYMSSYGEDKLLLGWKSNSRLVLASFDANSGELLEGPVITELNIDDFQEMKTTAEGDVLWAWANETNDEVQVIRIATCSLTGECEANELEQELLEAHNAARLEARECGDEFFPAVSALSWNCQLVIAAARHNQDMISNDFFAHEGSDGSRPWHRAEDTGYIYRTIGENIAAGYNSVESVMNGWLNSPGHCANIMNASFEELGTHLQLSNSASYSSYWTAVLGTHQ